MSLAFREPLVMREPTTRTTGPTPDDGTSQLLRTGIGVLLVGAFAALLTATIGGGIGEHGPHTNSGWLLLILAMMCLPFGTMLTLLGVAKLLRNLRLGRKPGERT
jgi:hypothetical protein